MAEITLRTYLKQVEDYIKEQRLEEALAHSAHILGRYPKNAAAYRALGRALMQQKRYEEAGEVFRRLLGAIPDDFAAHYQLSIVYDEMKQPDQALWHVERAFDQQSANASVNERLRMLYQKHRNLKVDKIQLTAGAVANQYIAAQMYVQAIDILQRTLRKMPNRGDLRLKLARALWASGQPVDAAETALEVLRLYPYALDANRILTELWLDEERPSDAQRYLSRIEDVDPYLAMQLATGERRVADDTFMLDELDFRRYAAAVTTAQSPDWLESLDFADADESAVAAPADVADEAWLADIAPEQAPPSQPKKKVTEDLGNLLPDDFEFPDSMGVDDTVAAADMSDLPDFGADEADLDDLLGVDTDSDAWLDEVTPAEEVGTSGLRSGMLAKLSGDDEEEVASDEDDDWLSELAAANIVSDSLKRGSVDPLVDEADDLSGEDAVVSDDSELGWLDDEDLDDTSPSAALSVPDDQPPAAQEIADPLAWLGEEADEDEDAAVTDESVAWMQDTGIEFDDDAEVVPTLFDEDDPVTLKSEPASPMAWLEDTGVEVEDAEEELFEVADTTNLSYYEESRPIDREALEDPMAWIESADAELAEEEMFAPDPVEEESDPEMDWLGDDSVLDEMLDIHELTEGDNSQFESAANDFSEEEAEEGDDFFAELEWEEAVSEEDEGFFHDAESLFATDEGEGGLEWLGDDDLLAEEDIIPGGEVAADSSPEWLNEDEDLEVIVDEGQYDPMAWLHEDEEAADDAVQPLAGTEIDDPLAWLNETGAEIIKEAEPEKELEWLTEDEDILDEAELEWLGEEDAGLGEDDAQPWAAELPEDDYNDEFSIESDIIDATGEEFEFDDAVEIEDAPMRTGMLDFLNTDDSHDVEAADWVGEIDVSEAFGDSEADWLSDLDDNTASALDWMSEPDLDAALAEDEALEAEATSVADWAEGIEQPEAENADMDWLGTGDEEDTLEPVAEVNWDESEFGDEDGAVSDMDWGNDFDEDDELEGADIDWLSDEEAEADELEPVAEATSDWGADFDEDDELEGADIDWLSDEEAEADELEPVAEATSDWGADFGEADELAEAEIDWLTDDEEAEADELEPAAEATSDWGAVGEDEELEEGEIDWLTDDEDEEEELEPVAETESGWADDLELEDEALDEVDWASDFEEEEEEDYQYSATAGMTGLLDDIRSTQEESLLEALESEEEEPDFSDWLDEEEEAEPVAETGWTPSDDDEDVFADEPDWFEVLDKETGALSPKATTEPETALDWGDAGDEEEAEVIEADAASAWGLSDEEEEAAELEPVAESEDSFDDFDFGDEEQSEESGWMGELDADREIEVALDKLSQEMAAVAADEEEAEAEPADADWLSELDEEEAEVEPVAEAESGWGADFEEEEAELEPVAEAESSWGADFDEDEDELEPVAEAESDWGADFDEDEDELVAEAFEELNVDYDEELETSTADNAPDWLNAMVPGLDLDYQAEEDAPIDEGFSEGSTHRNRMLAEEAAAATGDFAWLQDIVEEETGRKPSIDVDEAEEAALRPTVRRFIFSKLPVWLRGADTAAQATAEATVEVPDYLADFDDLDDLSDDDFDDFEFEDDFD